MRGGMVVVRFSTVAVAAVVILLIIAYFALIEMWRKDFEMLDYWMSRFPKNPSAVSNAVLFWLTYFLYQRQNILLAYITVLTILNIIALIALLMRTKQ